MSADGPRSVLNKLTKALRRRPDAPDAPPPFPIDPRSGTIELPSALTHELFHLVLDGNAPEAVRRVRALTGAGPGQAEAYVDTLLLRR
jgi:hypothetical protein